MLVCCALPCKTIASTGNLQKRKNEMVSNTIYHINISLTNAVQVYVVRSNTPIPVEVIIDFIEAFSRDH